MEIRSRPSMWLLYVWRKSKKEGETAWEGGGVRCTEGGKLQKDKKKEGIDDGRGRGVHQRESV